MGNKDKQDKNFQGFGRFFTGSTGEYLFRTTKPVPYPGRTPHIHVAVKMKGRPKFTTQCYIEGHAQNERDGVLRGIKDAKQRASVIVPFTPAKSSKIGELAAKFDIVMGFTARGVGQGTSVCLHNEASRTQKAGKLSICCGKSR